MRKKLWQVVAVLGLLAVVGGGALAYLGGEARVMHLKTEAPSTVVVGQPFDVWITLENISTTEQTIVSIGVENSLEMLEMIPSYRTVEHRGAWTEYVFARQRRPVLLSDETLQVRLRLIAPEVGDTTTEVVVWYNNHIRSDYIKLNLHVVSHPTPWLGR